MRPVPVAAYSFATIVILAAASGAQQYKTEKFSIGGEGAFDYLAVEPSTGHVFISRGTHMMVVDGATGKVLGDIKDTPRVHGAAFAKNGMGFTTNGGDSTSTMFDAKTLQVHMKIKAGKDGLDGIMYDDATDKILTIDHSRPVGTAVVIDPKSGEVVNTISLNSTSPEGGVSNGKDRIYINLEDKNSIDVIDSKTWKVVDTWKIEPCDGPTGIAMDRTTNRIFVGCDKKSVVVNAATGKVVATIDNGGSVDAMGWDQSQKLMYIPSGDGNVTVVHEDSPDKYSHVATVQTTKGARTIAVDPDRHVAYVFSVEYGPSTPPATPGGRPVRGPVTAAWLTRISK